MDKIRPKTDTPPDSPHTLGKKGEDLAERYLRNKGFEVLERNFRVQGGEIDIVARLPQKKSLLALIVFVEVKTRSSNSFGDPGESITPEKVRRLRVAAEAFLYQHPEYEEMYCRFDVLALSYNGRDFSINHIEDAFI